MLSEHTISTVQLTIPALEEHGVTLTSRFYERMFEYNPEVMPFFNPANQKAGRQQKALAAAIVAYAKNIENLEVLTNAVELISQKHVSLMVKREHYPIVGSNLLGAISDVLGEAATDDVLTAWGEAYNFLADILATREEAIVSDNLKLNGGWSGFKDFTVSKKREESSVITSFYLTPVDGKDLPDFLPGQYITLRLPTAEGSTTMRNYSLSDSPNRDHFRISVKREDGIDGPHTKGHASNLLHSEITQGDTIEVGPPCGEFFLDDQDDTNEIVLLAGGVGITPLYAMLKTELASERKRPVAFIHACLNPNTQAFKSEIDALEKSHTRLTTHNRYSDIRSEILAEGTSSGFVDVDLIQRSCNILAAKFYICGPSGFMSAMEDILLTSGVSADQIRSEAFGPKT